jgi:hypothetical protein
MTTFVTVEQKEEKNPRHFHYSGVTQKGLTRMNAGFAGRINTT